MMKRQKTLFTLYSCLCARIAAVLLPVLMALFSCTPFSSLEGASGESKSTARLKMSACLKEASASRSSVHSRTALPALTELDFTEYTLVGSLTGSSESTVLGQWESYEELTNAEPEVTAASWDFVLTAQKGGVLYTGSLTAELARGDNSLTFALALSQLENTGSGDVSVSLSVPSAVTAAKVGLYQTDGVSAVIADEAYTVASGTIAYTKTGIASGTYIVIFKLYADAACTQYLGSWREYATITDGVESTSSPTMSAVDSVFALDYKEADGSAVTLSDSSAAGSFTRRGDDITLPEAVKAGCAFGGWYADDALTAFVGAAGETVTCTDLLSYASGDTVTLYAFWIEPVLYVSESGTCTGLANGGAILDGLTSATALQTLSQAASQIPSLISAYSTLQNADWTVYISGTVKDTVTIGAATASSVASIALVGKEAAPGAEAVLDGDSAGTVLTVNCSVPVTISELTITGGSGFGGGGMYIASGAKVTLSSGVQIKENTAGDSYSGGGVYIKAGGTLTMTDDAVISSNTAKAGGGVYNEGTLVMEDESAISSNHTLSGGYGGGVYNAGGTLFMHGNAVIGSKVASSNATDGACSNYVSANAYGGGIYTTGGAIYLGYSDETTADSAFGGGIMYNYAGYQGGGIYSATGGTSILMCAGAISYNGAHSDGGGVRLGGSGDSFTMSGGEVCGNKANITSGSGGGGVYIGAASSASVSGGAIEDNTAFNGGGVYVNSEGAFSMTAGIVLANGATTDGGGVYVSGGARFTMTGGAIGGTGGDAMEVVLYANSAAGVGGGIYNAGTVRITGSTAIVGNADILATADAYANVAPSGGGIYNTGTLVVSDGNICGNYASKSGTDAGGGGIYNTGSLTLSDNAGVTNNSTAQDGGGIYTKGVFAMSDGVISGNSSDSRGGGVCIMGASEAITLSGGSISGNNVYSQSSAAAGGGIYIGGDSSFTCTLSGVGISGNNAEGSGAGVYLNNKNATLSMTAGSIDSNKAALSGGGIYGFSGAIQLSGGSIEGNAASDSTGKGGAVYVGYVTAAVSASIALSGSISIPSESGIAQDNDVYLANTRIIAATGTLSADEPVATITPYSYAATTQVLTGDVATSDNYKKFAVTPSGSTQYYVDSSGYLTTTAP